MKKRTIGLLLNNKINHWLETIQDERVRGLAAKNTIVTGGCIASMLLGEDVNDYDLYFRNYETAKAVAQYYINQFVSNPTKKFTSSYTGDVKIYLDEQELGRVKIVVKSAGAVVGAGSLGNYQYFETLNPNDPATAEFIGELVGTICEENKDPKKEKAPYRPVFLSSNAITLSDQVQLIFRFFGEPDEIHGNYDYAHCTNYWSSWDRQVVTRPKALEALLSKELIYCGSKYPICSVFRIRKFIERGWHITAGQILKMAMQIHALDLNDYKVLEDQLTGVDVAYFTELLYKLKDKNPEVVDSSYLMQLIDKLI